MFKVYHFRDRVDFVLLMKWERRERWEDGQSGGRSRTEWPKGHQRRDTQYLKSGRAMLAGHSLRDQSKLLLRFWGKISFRVDLTLRNVGESATNYMTFKG